MQLAGIRAGDRRAGQLVAQRLGPPHRGWRAGQMDLAVAAPAPGGDGGACSARRRPEGPAQDACGRRQQPVQALAADRTNPTLRECVGVRRLHRRAQHLGALGAEHVIEPATGLRVTVADKKATSRPGSPSTRRSLAGIHRVCLPAGDFGLPGGVDRAEMGRREPSAGVRAAPGRWTGRRWARRPVWGAGCRRPEQAGRGDDRGGRGQVGNGTQRNRSSARRNSRAHGQRVGRCRCHRRAERVSRPGRSR
jgi:hypothetical protein